jgi:nucleoside-diphosphate-sugar epimerase
MIVGTGMMAKAFENSHLDEHTIVFASGVSNSLETRLSEFDREKKLLEDTILHNTSCKLIYFSTCSISDAAVSDRPYVKHKIFMEDFLASLTPNYLICRVSNVVGKNGNPNTLINYLFNCISKDVPYQAWINSERNIIDVSDLVYFVEKLDAINASKKTINIANSSSYKVLSIIHIIESFLQKKSKHESLHKGVKLNISTEDISLLVPNFADRFKTEHMYITDILKKYYFNA